jgi:CheY-like chemotaxis protein
MATSPLKLLLADDDADDRMFFREALEELPVNVKITTVNDGVQLMNHLLGVTGKIIPDILFLDLNMPLKNGFDCLSEIKRNDKLKLFPVVIYSTSLNDEVVNSLYDNGADYYLHKPGDFSKLRKVIHEAITFVTGEDWIRPPKEKFIIRV